MSRSDDPNSHHRRSIRLRGYDYDQAGAYFVTICTRVHSTVFGGVVRGVMHLNDAGLIAAEAWSWLEDQYPYVILDAWVVMPDHMHGIIVIDPRAGTIVRMDDGGGVAGVGRDDVAGEGRGASRGAPTTPSPSPSPLSPTSMPTPLPIKPLGQLIGAYKTVSTKRINLARGTPGGSIWQRNYYEHIIRDAADRDRVRAYIAANPARWDASRGGPPADDL